jgi:hypothetical protein
MSSCYPRSEGRIRRMNQKESKRLGLPELTATEPTRRGVALRGMAWRSVRCDSLGNKSCRETHFVIGVIVSIIDEQQALGYAHAKGWRKLTDERSPCYNDVLCPTR